MDFCVRNRGFRLRPCIPNTLRDAHGMKKPLILLTLACLVSCQTKEQAPAAEEKPAEEAPAAPKIDVMKPDSLIGLPIEQVQADCDEAKIPPRVVEVDGEPRPMTMDYRPERLNFKVKDGKVTEVKNG